MQFKRIALSSLLLGAAFSGCDIDSDKDISKDNQKSISGIISDGPINFASTPIIK